ncbi:hypothetical protein H4R34_004445 [Dimargaris verticillata]|uniref:Uncharacterized protein n=1 Tax=Dimargaris verticillata TaxID=2761393 RepID=A0A9W8B4X1_9FUNG|nr:hypothetical protein H4R34_004445 [Dimargaris verticillata]
MQRLFIVFLVGAVFSYGVTSAGGQLLLPTEDPTLGQKTHHDRFNAWDFPQRPELQAQYSDTTTASSLASGSTLRARSSSSVTSADSAGESICTALPDDYPPPQEDSEVKVVNSLASASSVAEELPSYEASVAGLGGNKPALLSGDHPPPQRLWGKLRNVVSAVHSVGYRRKPKRSESLETLDALLARLRWFLASGSQVEFGTQDYVLTAEEKQDQELLENMQKVLVQILFSPKCNYRQLVSDILVTAPLERTKALLKPLQIRYAAKYWITRQVVYNPIEPKNNPQFDQVNVPLYLLRKNEFDASLYFLTVLKTSFPSRVRSLNADITWVVVIDDLLKHIILRQQNNMVGRVLRTIGSSHFYVTSLVTNLLLAIWLDQRDTAKEIYEAITGFHYSVDWFLESTHISLNQYFFEPSDEATLACHKVFYESRRQLFGIPPNFGFSKPSKLPDALELANLRSRLLQVLPYRSAMDYRDMANVSYREPNYRF